MYKGVSYIFIVPWLVLLALVAGVWVRRGWRVALLTTIVGIVVLVVGFAAMIAFYYANGGH